MQNKKNHIPAPKEGVERWNQQWSKAEDNTTGMLPLEDIRPFLWNQGTLPKGHTRTVVIMAMRLCESTTTGGGGGGVKRTQRSTRSLESIPGHNQVIALRKAACFLSGLRYNPHGILSLAPFV